MTVATDGGARVRRRHTLADLYHERTNFSFIARSWRWAVLSGVLLVIGTGALFARGLNLGIDFKGGTSWQVKVAHKTPSVPDVRDLLDKAGLANAKVTVLEPTSGSEAPSLRVQAEVLKDPIGSVRGVLAEVTGRSEADVSVSEARGGATWRVTADKKVTEAQVRKALSGTEGIKPAVSVKDKHVTVTVDKVPANPRDAVTSALAKYAGVKTADVTVNTVGPTWGEKVSRKALQALFFFFVLLAFYLSIRFEWKMAVAAIIAVLHDIAITVGFYAVFHFQVTPATVTAFLTILGFSLYDTVVVFDKVRENTHSLTAIGRTTYSEMVNRSLNQVLMRSLSTTLVALLPVISLLVVGSIALGAVTLQDFALALLAGLLVGSYSSIFVAAPVLAWWKEREPQHAALRARSAKAAAASQDHRLGGAPAPATLATAAPASTGELAGSSEERPGVPASPGSLAARPRQPRRRKRR